MGENQIESSLSSLGCPYDNAVAETACKIIKIEFGFDREFESLMQLGLELFDYVNWYNTERIYEALGYMISKQYSKFNMIEKMS